MAAHVSSFVNKILSLYFRPFVSSLVWPVPFSYLTKLMILAPKREKRKAQESSSTWSIAPIIRENSFRPVKFEWTQTSISLFRQMNVSDPLSLSLSLFSFEERWNESLVFIICAHSQASDSILSCLRLTSGSFFLLLESVSLFSAPRLSWPLFPRKR